MPKTPPYSEAFKREAVQMSKTSGRSLAQLAEELGVSRGSLANWVSQAEFDGGQAKGLTTDERDELRRLRREVKVLAEEREILKKAAAFFARDGESRR
jgi:transposase